MSDMIDSAITTRIGMALANETSKKLEEGLVVTTPDGTTIEEEEEKEDDIILEMNTGDGFTQFKAEKMKGRLNAMIISADKSCHIDISSELGYPIFVSKEYIGTTYVVPKTQVWNEDGHSQSFNSEFFNLNESLIFTISGQSNTNVKFIIRLEC